MKKLLIALVLGLLLVAGFASVAFADNGPHGSFSAVTDACAGCHRTHTAQYGSNSLLVMDPESLCLSCHNGSGAGTNVEDGVYSQAGSDAHYGASGPKIEGTDGGSLFGGGFANALMATAWSGKVTADPAYNATSKATTSAHVIGATGTIWGSGAINTPNGSTVLECTSCHDPHGTAGYTNTGTTNTGNLANACDPAKTATYPCTTKVASYRLLRWQPQGSGGFTPPAASVNWSGGAFPSNSATTGTSGWTVPDNFATVGAEWYTIGTTGAFAVGDYNAGNANNAYQPTGYNYVPAGINVAFFCAQCHDRYFNNSRLRNNTDNSMYCGSPLNATTPPYTGSPLFLPYYPDADAAAPWIHPVDPARCEPVVSTTTGLITGWGDNGSSGDTVYTYRHSSGDIRLSMDGATNVGGGTSISRACVACHVSHGTTATATALAVDATLAGDSTLRRMDNSSLCLRCHASTVNFTVGP